MRVKMKKAPLTLKIMMLCLVLAGTGWSAPTGNLTGTVVDAESGQPMLGVNVMIEGTSLGSATDLNGNFLIRSIPVGNYSINATYIGYSKIRVEDVTIHPGQVERITLAIHRKNIKIQEVVVTAKAVKNTEAALLKYRQRSQSLSDAVSVEGMSKAGLGTAAEAMKKITGASVVGGKYVYVRGLGDRYTSTCLNGAEIPSADPYTRSGTIDIVPTNLIDNVVTNKSSTPDKPANFSGGSVDIKTKDFPENFNMSFAYFTAYNTSNTLQNRLGINNLGYSHLLGFDNGSLDIPSFVPDTLRYVDRLRARKDSAEAAYLEAYTESFNHNMSPREKKIPLNQKYSLSIGNQTQLMGRTLGYIASAMYSHKFSGYHDGTYSRWMLKSTAEHASGLENMYNLNDEKINDNVIWGLNFKTSYKLSNTDIISFTTMRNQNSIATGRKFVGSFPYDLKDSEIYIVESQLYKERKLSSYQLEGKHQLTSLGNTKVEWKTSYANSNQNEPDLRYLTYSMNPNGGNATYNVRSNIPQERYFRDLTEDRMDGNFNVTVPLNDSEHKSKKLKFGAAYGYKNRDFTERRFIYDPPEDIGTILNQKNGNLDSVFTSDNLGILGYEIKPNGKKYYNVGIYLKETNQLRYNYTGEQYINAYYLMTDLFLTDKLRLIGGARYERTDMEVASADTTQPVGTIITEDILPSFNIVYSFRDNLNLRVAYGKTLARPSFREISPLVSYDFKEGDKFIGNAGLKRTLIDNYDLRMEWFNAPGQLLAVSTFYKHFKNPIEMVIKDINYWHSWVNVDQAISYGLELEFRQKLGFIHRALDNFSLNSNASFIHSEVARDSLELVTKQRTNPNIEPTRPFQGQSPYLFNLTLSYDNNKNNISATLYYNIFGERLAAIGRTGTPDIYEKPAETLNFTFSKGLTQHIILNFSVTNLLNSQEKEVYNFKGQNYISKLHREGRTISLGLKYNI